LNSSGKERGEVSVFKRLAKAFIRTGADSRKLRWPFAAYQHFLALLLTFCAVSALFVFRAFLAKSPRICGAPEASPGSIGSEGMLSEQLRIRFVGF